MPQQMRPVVPLSLEDLGAVETLRAHNNETLGFLPKSVMADCITRGGGLGVRAADGLLAYVLFGCHKRHVRIIHLCVSARSRGCGHARQLVEAVVQRATESRLGVVKLNCRHDYPANAAWPALGFVPLAERRAKTPGRWLVTWYRVNPDAPQPDFFSTVASEDKVHAAIDAQILFQLQAGDSDVAKGLQADFLADVLELHITDETLNEINRSGSPERRRRSRDYALTFPRLPHDEGSIAPFVQRLEGILPTSTRSQESDVRQIAMTAASVLRIFLTRDSTLLKKAGEIRRLTSVDVLHPSQLIVRLAEFTDKEPYDPLPVSGMNLAWRRFREGDLASIAIETLLGPHERKGALKARLDEVLSNPHTWRTEGLWSDRALVAVRSVKEEEQRRRLVIGLCRAAPGQRQPFFTDYAIASVLSQAVKRSYGSVLIEPDSTTPETIARLPQLGFTATDKGFIGDCPAIVMPSSELRASVHPRHRDAPRSELEKACSPVALEDGVLDVIMVPIKPAYARSLFDTELASGDLFGGQSGVLLRLENVYYRKKSHHRMIRAPARILWYESAGAGVVAMSHLDCVRIGTPKDMFRKHQRLGTLSWPDIWAMCRGDELQEIMVLKFSHSYMLRSPLDLRRLKDTYRRHSRNLQVQSPSRVPREVFLDIYRLGFQAASRS